MELLEFIKANPEIVEIAKNCKTQDDLHKLIVENNINLKNISENELFQIIKETQKQNEQVEDELLETVAGGGDKQNRLQRKLAEKINNKVDPSKLTLDTEHPYTLEQVVMFKASGSDAEYMKKGDNYFQII